MRHHVLFSVLKIAAFALVAFLLVTYIRHTQPEPALPMDDSSVATTTEHMTTAIFHTNRGNFTLELFTDAMPITTGNFIKLAEDGYYNDTRFHRVIDGFMVQGGDPLTKDATQSMRWGTGGPGYTIQDEFVAGLSNVRGTIAMANTGQPNSGGSQFFINVVDNLGLDFDKPPMGSSHPVFGKVISGMDIVDAIAKTDVDASDRPVEEVIINRVEIVRN